MTPDERLDELVATEQALDAFEQAPTAEYYGAQLMRAGLERRRTQILAYRMSAVPRPAQGLDLTLEPAANATGGVDVSLVASVLNALQETVQAFAQSLKDRPTARGVVPVEIQQAVRLRVSFALPGSLDLRLVAAEPAAQRPLFEDSTETLLELSVEALLSLVEAAAAGDVSGILKQIAASGPRVTTHLEALTGALSKADTAASFRWRSGGVVRATALASGDATTFNGLLNDVKLTTRDHVFTGRLVGGSLVRGLFELELADGSVLAGKADDVALAGLEQLFGQPCAAAVEVRETRLPSGETREAFLLKSLTP